MEELLNFIKDSCIYVYIFYIIIWFIHDICESISINKYKYIKVENQNELSKTLIKCSYPVDERYYDNNEKLTSPTNSYLYCRYILNPIKQIDGSYSLDKYCIYNGKKNIFTNDEISKYDYPIIVIQIMKYNRIHFNFKHFLLKFLEHCILYFKK